MTYVLINEHTFKQSLMGDDGSGGRGAWDGKEQVAINYKLSIKQPVMCLAPLFQRMQTYIPLIWNIV